MHTHAHNSAYVILSVCFSIAVKYSVCISLSLLDNQCRTLILVINTCNKTILQWIIKMGYDQMWLEALSVCLCLFALFVFMFARL